MVIEARFLLDTNICIYIKRKRPPQALARFRDVEVGLVNMSAITYGELLYGAYGSVEADRAIATLDELTRLIPVRDLPPRASLHYGRIRADLTRRGTPIGSNDLWIAAHALAADLILVTNNEREFRRIEGLRVENWAAEGA